MPASSFSSSFPAWPTNGTPCLSSWKPGASPTKIRSASGWPAPKTTCVRPRARTQRVQPAVASAYSRRSEARAVASVTRGSLGPGPDGRRSARSPPLSVHRAVAHGGRPEGIVREHRPGEPRAVSGGRRRRRPAPPAGRRRRSARSPPLSVHRAVAHGGRPEGIVREHRPGEPRAVSGGRRRRRPAPPAGRRRRSARSPPLSVHRAVAHGGRPEGIVREHRPGEPRAVSGGRRRRRPAPPAGRRRRPVRAQWPQPQEPPQQPPPEPKLACG